MKTLKCLALVAAAMAPLIAAMPGTAGASARTASTSSAARQYLVDCAPVDKASAAFQSTAISWMGNPSVTGPEAGSAARPLISALVTFQKQLENQNWPTGARKDIRALVSAFNGLVGDLRALSHDDIADTSSWEGPLLSEDVSTTAATNKVRHDLGLPALSASV
jgi:hypothetical protein